MIVTGSPSANIILMISAAEIPSFSAKSLTVTPDGTVTGPVGRGAGVRSVRSLRPCRCCFSRGGRARLGVDDDAAALALRHAALGAMATGGAAPTTTAATAAATGQRRARGAVVEAARTAAAVAGARRARAQAVGPGGAVAEPVGARRARAEPVGTGCAVAGAVRARAAARVAVARRSRSAAVGPRTARSRLAILGLARTLLGRRRPQGLRVARRRRGDARGRACGRGRGRGAGDRARAGEGARGRRLVDRVAADRDAGLGKAGRDLVRIEAPFAGNVSDTALGHLEVHGSASPRAPAAAGRPPRCAAPPAREQLAAAAAE